MSGTDRERREAEVGRTVSTLVALPDGVAEVLAHLYSAHAVGARLGLPALRAAMIRRRRPDDSPYPVPVDFSVEHSLLYDLGQLAVGNIVEVAGDEGHIVLGAHHVEGVRLYLLARLPHLARFVTDEYARALRRDLVGGGEAS